MIKIKVINPRSVICSACYETATLILLNINIAFIEKIKFDNFCTLLNKINKFPLK